MCRVLRTSGAGAGVRCRVCSEGAGGFGQNGAGGVQGGCRVGKMAPRGTSLKLLS